MATLACWEPIPDTQEVYALSTVITLYRPERLPDLSQQRMIGGKFTDWPRLSIKGQQKTELSDNPLETCYAHNVAYRTDSTTRITLEEALSTGFREHPAQMWLMTSESPTRRLVVHIYDTLYYNSIERFGISERAVATKNEA
jgi:hypothetical protein